DVAKLLASFRKLIAAGHSLIVIEHNLDVIRASDWIVDLGPEGGEAGGEIVACGTPEQVMGNEKSHTGRALAQYEKALGPSPRPSPKGEGEHLCSSVFIRGSNEVREPQAPTLTPTLSQGKGGKSISVR